MARFAQLQPHPVHARPDALGHHRHRVLQEDPETRERAVAVQFIQGPVSPTWCWPTRSTARRPRRRRLLLEAMQEQQSRWAGKSTRWTSRSSCWPRRTRSSRRGPTRCRRPNWTASCSTRSLQLSQRGRGAGDRQADHGRRGGQGGGHAGGGGNPRPAADRPPGAGGRPRGPLCTAARPAHPRPTSPTPGVHPRVRQLGAAGPRASQYLVLGAKARAVLHGRYHVATEDIRAVAYPVLRHRILTNFNAEAEGIKPDGVIRRLIDTVADGTGPGRLRWKAPRTI